MMRNTRKNETKSGSNKIVFGELLMGILVTGGGGGLWHDTGDYSG